MGEYDPATALWGGGGRPGRGPGGRGGGPPALRPGGLIAVEHGAPQGRAVYWAFPEERGWQQTRNHKDLAGRDRFVTAVWGRGGWSGHEPTV